MKIPQLISETDKAKTIPQNVAENLLKIEHNQFMLNKRYADWYKADIHFLNSLISRQTVNCLIKNEDPQLIPETDFPSQKAKQKPLTCSQIQNNWKKKCYFSNRTNNSFENS